MSDDADVQRQHLLQLEKLARVRHGLSDDEPVPLHLLPTPLADEILSAIDGPDDGPEDRDR